MYGTRGLRASDIVGYEEWPVLLRRTEPSTQVSQLVFPVVAPGLADESVRARDLSCVRFDQVWVLPTAHKA